MLQQSQMVLKYFLVARFFTRLMKGELWCRWRSVSGCSLYANSEPWNRDAVCADES